MKRAQRKQLRAEQAAAAAAQREREAMADPQRVVTFVDRDPGPHHLNTTPPTPAPGIVPW